jgi:dipeptidyl aminopeptidase/acylaminoacyl peptidase
MSAVQSPLPVAAYERAERMLWPYRSGLVLRGQVVPEWIGDGSRFWYRVDTARGREFVLVDPEKGVRAPAFDHERLAAALSAAGGRDARPYDLPVETIMIGAGAGAVEGAGEGEVEVGLSADDTRWRCRIPGYACERAASGPLGSPLLESASPDGRWVAFRRGHDLWVRSAATGEESALTTDGTADRGYAVHPDCARSAHLLRRLGVFEATPVVLWSSDSRRLLLHRTDQRGVPLMHLVESAPADGGRPRVHRYRYAMPSEPVPRGEWLIIDVPSRTVVAAAAEPFILHWLSPIQQRKAWWSADGATVYHLEQPRDPRTLRLNAIDAATGDVRTLIEETGDTRVEAAQSWRQRPMVHVLAGGHEALWYSQRDGWGHLYRYDLDGGTMAGQVTKGAYTVQRILHVDEGERVAYLAVSGLVADDPYRRSLVRVGLDGGEPARLTDDDLDHEVTAPPHGRWFVDSASTPDTPPVTTVRGRDGSVLIELERADATRLVAAGWSPPERVRTVAADGATPVYGLLYKPHGFDPARRYPVVDHPYPGPQITRVQPTFYQGALGCEAEALAALGFAVLAVDGRGTPGRDKTFHDHSYRNLGSCGGLDDHVAALHQLAATRPWLDLDLVGIFGTSGGGFTAVRALLTYPRTYKVGVAEAGNHDNRFYQAVWAEHYDGPCDADAHPDVAARLSNTELAGNLAGRLLLVHGEMDDNVTPYLTMRLVDRLIAANKDFDLLIVPGAEHSFVGSQHYVIRRRWDYLVRHLMGCEPPEYRLADLPAHPDAVARIVG